MAYKSKYTGTQIEALLDSIPNKAGKSDFGTAAAKDVPANGNASTGQVVLGNDTRLTDSRPASDVQAWAKAKTKPTYTAAEVGAMPSSTKVPTKTSELTNDSGFLTKDQDLSEYAKKTDLAAVTVSGMVYSIIKMEAEVTLSLEMDHIYDLEGDGMESLNLNLPEEISETQKGHSIIIRFYLQSVSPTINISSDQVYLDERSDMSSMIIGHIYEMTFTDTTSGWILAILDCAPMS